MVQVNLRLPPDELVAIDGARGGVSRNDWLREAARLRLGVCVDAVDRSVPARTLHGKLRAEDAVAEVEALPEYLRPGH